MHYIVLRRQEIISMAFLALFILGASTAAAQWSHDPSYNTSLTTGAGAYYQMESVEDGNGGMISVWKYYDSIYGQRISSQGSKMWGGTDQLLFPDDSIWGEFKLVSDGTGGAYFIWHNPADDGHIIRAQHFDSDGEPMWAETGIPVINFYQLGTVHSEMDAASDGDGGLLVTWVNEYNGYKSIQVQRFSPTGSRLYSSTLASDGSTDKASPTVRAGEDPGSAVAAWQEMSGSGDWDIMGQYKSDSGVNLWTTTGDQTFVVTSGDQTDPMLEVAGNGRIICLCQDDSSGNQGLRFGQKSGSGGFFGYISSQGRVWDGIYDIQDNPRLARDEVGNVFALCTDRTENGGGRIAAQYFPYAQYHHFWGDLGQTLHHDEYTAIQLTALAAGQAGEFFVAREQFHGSQIYEIFRYGTQGGSTWCEDRGPFAIADIYYQNELRLLSSDQGRVIAYWIGRPEGSTSSSFRTFGQLIDSNGFMGDNQFDMIAVEDRPNDQGGELHVSWEASPLDNSAFHAIENYSLWIMDQGSAAATGKAQAMPEENLIPDNELAQLLKMDETDVALMRSTGYTYAGLVPAVFAEEYSAFCPSFGDSTEAGSYHTSVQVIAHHEETEVFWTSGAMTGFSVDNLAPGAPLALAGNNNDGAADLAWTASGSHDEDLALYRIYRSAQAGVEVSPTNLVGHSLETAFLDQTASGTVYYRVTAVDAHGNEGQASSEVMVQLAMSAVDNTPLAFNHGGNYPNPFNPMTHIAFDLPKAAQVRVTVYDAAGRQVNTLLSESMEAGHHEVRWNGQDRNGQAVSSGLYFSRVEAGEFTATRSMTLVR